MYRLLPIALTAGCLGVAAATVAAQQDAVTPEPYRPYAFLIGEWNVGPAAGPPAAVTRFRWGGARTFIEYSGALLVNAKEQPAFQGLLVWNGVRRNLDMLLVLEPASASLVQEQGTVRVEPDGTVVREITVFYSEGNPLPPAWDRRAGPAGASAEFRHTFKSMGPDTIATAIVRKSDTGWVPSFPGSDKLVMTRRAER